MSILRWLAGMLLPASIGVLVTICGTFAAYSQAPTKPNMPPPCGAFGPGFYPLLGPGTCIKPHLGVEGGVGWTSQTFDVGPPFDVNGNGGLLGVNGGLLFGVPGTSFAIGPRVSGLWGNISGSVDSPPASPSFTYKAEIGSIKTVEAEGVFVWSYHDFRGSDPFLPGTFSATIGAASTDTTVTGTSAGFVISDSVTRTGFTASFGVGMPIANTPIELFFRYRYINLPTIDVKIPGAVPIGGNINLFTVEADWMP